MKARGVVSDKERMATTIKTLAQNVKSLDELVFKLQRVGIEPYFRYGKATGIWFGNRKFRFTTLGMDKQKLKSLSQEEQRLQSLHQLKSSRSRGKGRER